MDKMKVFCPPFCGTCALVFSLLFAFLCESFKFEGKSYTFLNGTAEQLTVKADDIQFSPWYTMKTELVDAYVSEGTLYVTTQSECTSFDEDYDSKWVFVRAACIITVTYGGILTLLLCFVPCIDGLAAKIWHCSAVGFILICTLFQGLTFLVFKSEACEQNPVMKMAYDQVDALLTNISITTGVEINATDYLEGVGIWADECSWDLGSTLNVVGICCWFFAGVSMLGLGQPKDESILGGSARAAGDKAGDAGEGEQEQPAEKLEEVVGESKKGDDGMGAVADVADVAAEKNDAEA